jgi:hypothetical protein
MKWLNDISEKLNQERRKARLEAAQFEHLRKRECRRANPLVLRLLRDLGKMWFGGSWLARNYEVRREEPGRWQLARKRPFEEEVLVVNLEVVKESKPYFRVYSQSSGSINTVDTSREELVRALRTAAARLMAK